MNNDRRDLVAQIKNRTWTPGAEGCCYLSNRRGG